MSKLNIALFVTAMQLLVPVAHAASCTEGDVATYHRLERQYQSTLDKCVAALDRKSANVCSICKPLHDAMWKAERWRDAHKYCIEQTKANLDRARRAHELTKGLDKALKADCGL